VETSEKAVMDCFSQALGITSVGQRVQIPYLIVGFPEEKADEVRTYESAATSNQNDHRRKPPADKLPRRKQRGIFRRHGTRQAAGYSHPGVENKNRS